MSDESDVEITLDIVSIGAREPIDGQGPAILRDAVRYLWRTYGPPESLAIVLLMKQLAR